MNKGQIIRLVSMLLGIPCLTLTLSSCISVPLTTELPDTGNYFPVPPGSGGQEADLDQVADSKVPPGLSALYAQVNGHEFKARPGAGGPNSEMYHATFATPLSPPLANTSFMKAYVNAMVAERANSDPSKMPALSVDANDIRDFSEVFAKNFNDLISGPGRGDLRPSGAPSLDNILVDYYKDYFDGKFITREGVKLAKPSSNFSVDNLQISGSISTDTLSALLTVFLEGLHDYAQNVPEFSDSKGTYINNAAKTSDDSSKKPSCVVHGIIKEVSLPSDDYPKITEKNWRLTHYVTSAASSGSEALTTLVVKSIGGVSAGPVFVLGKISIGDNTTITKIIQTTLDINLRRDGEWLLFEALTKGARKPAAPGASADVGVESLANRPQHFDNDQVKALLQNP